MNHQTCDRRSCEAAAMYVVVSGCLKYTHINTAWYCTTHYMELTNDNPEPVWIVCWACYRKSGELAHVDDFIMQRL